MSLVDVDVDARVFTERTVGVQFFRGLNFTLSANVMLKTDSAVLNNSRSAASEFFPMRVSLQKSAGNVSHWLKFFPGERGYVCAGVCVAMCVCVRVYVRVWCGEKRSTCHKGLVQYVTKIPVVK